MFLRARPVAMGAIWFSCFGWLTSQLACLLASLLLSSADGVATTRRSYEYNCRLYGDNSYCNCYFALELCCPCIEVGQSVACAQACSLKVLGVLNSVLPKRLDSLEKILLLCSSEIHSFLATSNTSACNSKPMLAPQAKQPYQQPFYLLSPT